MKTFTEIAKNLSVSLILFLKAVFKADFAYVAYISVLLFAQQTPLSHFSSYMYLLRLMFCIHTFQTLLVINIKINIKWYTSNKLALRAKKQYLFTIQEGTQKLMVET